MREQSVNYQERTIFHSKRNEKEAKRNAMISVFLYISFFHFPLDHKERNGKNRNFETDVRTRERELRYWNVHKRINVFCRYEMRERERKNRRREREKEKKKKIVKENSSWYLSLFVCMQNNYTASSWQWHTLGYWKGWKGTKRQWRKNFCLQKK